MALRIVDTQMMIMRPAELANAQAAAQRQGGVNVNMAREMDDFTQQELNRPQATLPADGARINPDDEGGRGEGQRRERRGKPPESGPAAPEGAGERLARTMLNLPVDEGKFASDETHKIDIRV